MWPTIFVVENTELDSKKDMPPLSEGGFVMLYKKDTFDDSQVPCVYEVKRVIFDVYSIKQYVHLEAAPS